MAWKVEGCWGGWRRRLRVTSQEAKKTRLRDSNADSLTSQQHWHKQLGRTGKGTRSGFRLLPQAVSGGSSTHFQMRPSGWNQDGSSHHFPHPTSRTWCKENTRAWGFHTGLKAKHRYESSSATFQHSWDIPTRPSLSLCCLLGRREGAGWNGRGDRGLPFDETYFAWHKFAPLWISQPPHDTAVVPILEMRKLRDNSSTQDHSASKWRTQNWIQICTIQNCISYAGSSGRDNKHFTYTYPPSLRGKLEGEPERVKPCSLRIWSYMKMYPRQVLVKEMY